MLNMSDQTSDRNQKMNRREVRHFGDADAQGERKNAPRQKGGGRRDGGSSGGRGGNANRRKSGRRKKSGRPGDRRGTQPESARKAERDTKKKADAQEEKTRREAPRASEPRDDRAQSVTRRDEKPANQPSKARRSRRRNHFEDKEIRAEETVEDIRRDLDAIEKDIYLDIDGIRTINLDI